MSEVRCGVVKKIFFLFNPQSDDMTIKHAHKEL